MKSRLSQYTLENVDLFYSKDFDREATDNYIKEKIDDPLIEINEEHFFQLVIEQVLDDFLPPKAKELVDLYSKRNGLERIAILYAHGDMKDNKWCYSDGENLFNVQNWINQKDGHYKAILLKVCNEEGEDISSKKSILCYPNEVYSVASQKQGEVQVELFFPEIGHVDNYIIDNEIEKLKQEVN